MKQATCHPEQKHNAKGLCKPCYDKQRRPPEVNRVMNARPDVKAQKQDWVERRRAACPRFFADRHRLKRYGLSEADARRIMESQHGNCKICQKNLDGIRFHIDHDHTTGKVRGILCAACNTGIGMLAESEFSFLRAIAYLQYHGSLQTILPNSLVTSIRFVDLPTQRQEPLAHLLP